MDKTSCMQFFNSRSFDWKPEAKNLRLCIRALGVLFLAVCFPVQAQQPAKVWKIGVLVSATRALNASREDNLWQGLRQLGYVEGKNVVMEYRYADGQLDRLPQLAAELVGLKVDLIIVSGTRAAVAAKQATSTIPIIMTTVGDPVGLGFVASLARPGGNITGLSTYSTDLAGKRLELLKETIPKLSRVAIFSDPRSLAAEVKATEAAARLLKVQFIALEVRSLDELENAFRSSAKSLADAIVVGTGGFFNTNQRRLVELAAKHRLPGMYIEQEFVHAGGLMTYATSIPDLYRRAATYVDKILKGAKPADLPVE